MFFTSAQAEYVGAPFLGIESETHVQNVLKRVPQENDVTSLQSDKELKVFIDPHFHESSRLQQTLPSTRTRPKAQAKVTISTLPRGLVLLPVLIPLIILLVTGFQGLDFGHHWDEWYHVEGLSRSIREGVPYPSGLYDYPAMSYWLHVAGALPEVAHTVQSNWADVPAIKQHMLEYVQTPEYHLRMRAIFLVVSSLSVVWVYLLVLAWRRAWTEALLASAFVGLSWEAAYHFRWITPDGINTQFGALTMLLLFHAYQNQSRRWLWWAAIAAGLTCSSKYTGGIFLLPLLVTAYMLWKPSNGRREMFTLLGVSTAFFSATYLIVNVGILLQFKAFIQGMFVNDLQYYLGSHSNYTVPAGPEHFARIMLYLGMKVLSPYNPIALLFFCCVLFGAHQLYKGSRQFALIYLCVPVAYILFFSFQRVMIVRNLLLLIPFLAVLASYGCTLLIQRVRDPLFRNSLVLGVIVLLAINASWLFYTAGTIADRATNRFKNEFAAYVKEQTERTFLVSPQVAAALQEVGYTDRSRVITDPTQSANVVAFYSSEGLDYTTVPANDPDLFSTWFGPWEVNLDYYSSWPGDERIIVMPYIRAREIGVKFLR